MQPASPDSGIIPCLAPRPTWRPPSLSKVSFFTLYYPQNEGRRCPVNFMSFMNFFQNLEIPEFPTLFKFSAEFSELKSSEKSNQEKSRNVGYKLSVLFP